MLDPFNFNMTFGPSLVQIPYLSGVITDTHFVVRNRMGRMVAFLARMLVASPTPSLPGQTHAVGVDQMTALLLNTTTGMATIVGTNTAYICSSKLPPKQCVRGRPLFFANITCLRLQAGSLMNSFSFKTFSLLHRFFFLLLFVNPLALHCCFLPVGNFSF